jgi:integrase
VDLRRGLVYVLHGKGDRSSWTLLTPEAVAALEALRAAVRPADDDLVLPSRLTGEERSPTALAGWVYKLLRRAGLHGPGRSPHGLRRTAATLYLRHNPGDLKGLQKILRHEHLATTVLYVYLNPNDLAPRLARAFGNGADHG